MPLIICLGLLHCCWRSYKRGSIREAIVSALQNYTACRRCISQTSRSDATVAFRMCLHLTNTSHESPRSDVSLRCFEQHSRRGVPHRAAHSIETATDLTTSAKVHKGSRYAPTSFCLLIIRFLTRSRILIETQKCITSHIAHFSVPPLCSSLLQPHQCNYDLAAYKVAAPRSCLTHSSRGQYRTRVCQ